MPVRLVDRRALIGAAAVGTVGLSVSGCASDCDGTDCTTQPAPLPGPLTIRQTGFVDASITTSLASSRTYEINDKLSIIYDNFFLALEAGAREARVAHGVYNFALPKGKAKGFEVFVRGFQHWNANAFATLHVGVGRTARQCTFPSKKMSEGDWMLTFEGSFSDAIDKGSLPIFIALSGMSHAEKGGGQVAVDSIDLSLNLA